MTPNGIDPTKWGIIGQVIFDGSILFPKCILEYQSPLEKLRQNDQFSEYLKRVAKRERETRISKRRRSIIAKLA
jgi:hypothetical protein